MDQLETIKTLFEWLQENRWSDSLTVRCDHVGEAREELALFLGSKLPGEGRGSRIAQVDIVVCNEVANTVELIVEVDPNPNPKKVMGDILAVLLADNYTPSNSLSAYKIDHTLFIFLTVLDGRTGSQKEKQFGLIEQTLRSKLDLATLGLRDIRLCFGKDEHDAVARFQYIVEDSFGGGGEHFPPSLVSHNVATSPAPDATSAESSQQGYRFNPNFDRGELRRLLVLFRSAIKRKQDVRLALNLERELLERAVPLPTRATVNRLAKWCKTGGIYSDGMEVARKISQLLFGRTLDRDAIDL